MKDPAELSLFFAPDLRLFLRPHDRAGHVRVRHDGTSSLGHVVEAAGVPLTEVGGLEVGGRQVPPSYRPKGGDEVHVIPVTRPQELPHPARFLLDVHLGALARRLRLVGVDTAYEPALDDPGLVELANVERRVLLTRDRGLLRRRALWLGANVRGDDPDDQFADVLHRFAPPLSPWTRCPACNGPLEHVAKADVHDLLPAGTARTYDEFARCSRCGRPYWKGAHHGRLAELVRTAQGITRAERTSGNPA
ncbi:Mut7-C RNAse domain-containing protein [Actinocorallia sp. A-T 12471]|uniref:Mut7-C RNAse domain-containing protein n=1 Tax=Actinocorallia sp. A-T 12471 TaxID=3089813 RepID=UPI0029CB9A42|nr:Mut7-C RNAse domain-containing protein [Actinocorallia sp. A-T 12471]MDX6744811.1 Mut7-C RNAse domain-containing protein [Actinocorallia sp. A-T 12471]